MIIFSILLIVSGSFLFMEFVAWFTHKYVMHGFLWILHKDHHTREHEPFEWNDMFALIFALPSIILIVVGSANFDFRFWIGIGIAIYGLAYFVVLIPFFAVNGILTGSFIDEEVVWYNNSENLSIRIFTIPIEDAVYGLLLMLMNTTFYEYFKKTWGR